VLARRFFFLVLVPVVLIATGTLGYSIIEGQTPFDALYMTVVTLTTVGPEPSPKTPQGKLFTMLLLLGGVFTLFYTASELIRIVISGEVQLLLGRGRMSRSLSGLNNHLIVCGYGRMGRVVCREFSRQGLSFVLIDRRPDLLQDFNLSGGIALVGDGTSDEVLRRAGVDRARALVIVLPSDADNLYITMSARLLNARLFIVARAEGEEAEQKLVRAGADRVVAPYAIGANQVAQAVLRPSVLDFVELATRTEHLELQLEQTEVGAGSQLAGTTLTGSRLRAELGLIIVAIKKPYGAMIYTPDPDTVLEAGDILIALGKRSQLDQLEQLARARPA
jgi:voltage-gated potassium channel